MGHDVGEKGLVGLRPHNLDQGLGDCLVIVHAADGGKQVQLRHLLRHRVGVAGRQLGAVLPIDLIAVILLGIMAGGDVDAGDGVIFPHGEGKLRRGAQGCENPHRDAVARHDGSRLPGKFLRVVAAVVTDAHAPGRGGRAFFQNHLGEGLGGVTDHMDVHIVQSRTHGAPKTGGAEFQGAEKAAFDLLFIACDGAQLFPLRRAEGRAFQPLLIGLPVGHYPYLLLLPARRTGAKGSWGNTPYL